MIHEDEQVLCKVEAMRSYVMEELNVKRVSTSTQRSKFGVKLKAEPDFRLLGSKLGSSMKQVTVACKALTSEQLTVSSIVFLHEIRKCDTILWVF